MADNPYQMLIQKDGDGKDKKKDKNFISLYRKKPKYKKKDLVSLTKPFQELANEPNKELHKMMKDSSKDLKKVMYEIPYLKQVLMGGELAKLAFDYMVA